MLKAKRESRKIQPYTKIVKEKRREDFLKSTGDKRAMLMDSFRILEGTLSTLEHNPDEAMIQLNMIHVSVDKVKNYIPIIVSFLASEKIELVNLTLQFFINYPELVHELVNFGAISRLVFLIRNDNNKVCENSMLLLSDIVTENPYYRFSVLEEGIIDLIPVLCQRFWNTSTIESVLWLLRSICEYDYLYQYPGLQTKVLVLLQEVLENTTDSNITLHAIESLNSLTIGSHDRLDKVIAESQVINKVIDLLQKNPNTFITREILLVLGNISSGTTKQVAFLLENNILSIIEILLDYDDLQVRQYCCYVLSNMVVEGFNKTLFSQKLLIKVLEQLKCDYLELIEEVFWFVHNYKVVYGHDEFVNHFLSFQIVNCSDQSQKLLQNILNVDTQ